MVRAAAAYELQQPGEGVYQYLERPKVIWPEIARSVRFSWDEDGLFPNKTCMFMPEPRLWLLALLHSTAVQFLTVSDY